MRRYYNKKTGATINVHGQVNGKNWEPLDKAPVVLPEDLADPYSEIFGDDNAELPSAKPKTTRRRKTNGSVCNSK